MNYSKHIYLAFLVIITSSIFSELLAQTILQVSPNGPYYTLEEAYNAISVNAQNEVSQNYIVELAGDTVDVASDSKMIPWIKSGTATHSIKIVSNSNTILDKFYSHRTAFNLIGVTNVHVEGITFNNAKNGIRLVDADNCFHYLL